VPRRTSKFLARPPRKGRYLAVSVPGGLAPAIECNPEIPPIRFLLLAPSGGLGQASQMNLEA